MRTVAIVQARMGSTRLPGKVRHDLCGDTMLARTVQRLRTASSLAHVVIATTTNPEDDVLVREAKRLGAQVFRGSSHDVLDRYCGAARASFADAIVRVTSDCPLIEAGVVDRVVAKLTGPIDYASNTHDVQSFPRGLDCEVFHRDTLERMARMATSKAAREHVTVFVREKPELFCTDQLIAETDDSDLRWTVDTDADLELARTLFERFSLASRTTDYRDIVRAVRAEPSLRTINAHSAQKDWRVSAA